MDESWLKEELLKLPKGLVKDLEEFKIIFSTKGKKVSCNHKTKELTVKAKVFKDRDSVIYYSLLALAEHERKSWKGSVKADRFEIMKRLVAEAKKAGIYSAEKEADRVLTARICTIISCEKTMCGTAKRIGSNIMGVLAACEDLDLNPEDILYRYALMDNAEAERYVSAHIKEVSEEIGFSNMIKVARLKTPEDRHRAVEAIKRGESIKAEKKTSYDPPVEPVESVKKLEKKKERLDKKILNLQGESADLQGRIDELNKQLEKEGKK